MNRVTVRVGRKHDRELDALADDGVYPNKSEAIRAAIREFLEAPRATPATTDGFGTCGVEWCGGRAVATLEAETEREGDDGKRCRGCLAYDLDL